MKYFNTRRTYGPNKLSQGHTCTLYRRIKVSGGGTAIKAESERVRESERERARESERERDRGTERSMIEK